MKNKKIIILALILLLTVGCVKVNDNTADKNETVIVYCRECGKASAEVSKYCPKCGQETTWSTEKVEIEENQQEKNTLVSSSEKTESKKETAQNNNTETKKENTQNTTTESKKENNQNNNTESKKENTQSIKTENKSEQTATNESYNHKTNLNRRYEYINRLNYIEESMGDLDYLYENGTTIDMRRAESERYTRWDNMLNEIYSLIRKELSYSEAQELKRKEIAWIKYRDKKAENDADEYRGGTMQPLIHTSSLAQSTKERCYELVNTYMK